MRKKDDFLFSRSDSHVCKIYINRLPISISLTNLALIYITAQENISSFFVVVFIIIISLVLVAYMNILYLDTERKRE